MRILALAMGALVILGGLVALPSGASRSGYSSSSLRYMLITRSDLPTGWSPGLAVGSLDSSCSPIMSLEHLLGADSVKATYSGPGQHSVAFEYLGYRNNVVDAFERADTFIYTFGSCGESDNGVTLDSAVNDGTIVTRTFGTWSDADRYSYRIRSWSGQLGYLVVRDKDFLLVVGLGNTGTLKLKTMEGLTQRALAKLPVS